MPPLLRTTATETHRQEINTRTRSFISEYAPQEYQPEPSHWVLLLAEWCLVNGAVLARAGFYFVAHVLGVGAAAVVYLLGRGGDVSIFLGVCARKLEAKTGGGPTRPSSVLMPWLPGKRFEHKELGTGDYEVDVDDRSKEEAR